MDFIDSCDQMLATIVELEKDSTASRYMGVLIDDIVRALCGSEADHRSSEYQAVSIMVQELRRMEWIERGGTDQHIRPTRAGKLHSQGPFETWEQVCATVVDDDEANLIRAVNARSPQSASTYATVEYVPYDDLDVSDTDSIWVIANRLEQDYRLVTGPPYNANELRSTYPGLVWETRRGLVGESRWIDGLVAEGETTNVEFKREVYTGTADEQAKLIKVVLGLANTKASGLRWLIIGIDDKTRRYHSPPSPKIAQDHLEHLLARYTAPMVLVQYKVVEYRDGQIGKLEVLRDPTCLPYRVAMSLGDRKRINKGQVFVRHGSQTVEPNPAELTALIEEADRANLPD